MSLFKLPLSNIPQIFPLTMSGKDYNVTCKWNDSPDAGWVLDFFDALTNLPVVFNVPLVTGINILSGLEYLGFTGLLFIFTDGDETAVPTLTNLGVESNLYLQTEDA